MEQERDRQSVNYSHIIPSISTTFSRRLARAYVRRKKARQMPDLGIRGHFPGEKRPGFPSPSFLNYSLITVTVQPRLSLRCVLKVDSTLSERYLSSTRLNFLSRAALS